MLLGLVKSGNSELVLVSSPISGLFLSDFETVEMEQVLL
jgi:hypothetical protein